MSLLEKIVYLSDHIEDARNYEDVEKVRELSYKNMDAAIVSCTSSMIRDLNSKGFPISEQTVKTRNYYLMDNK